MPRKPLRITLADYVKPPPGLGANYRARCRNQWAAFDVSSVEREDEEEITAIKSDPGHGYEKVTSTVDSGAANTVGPPSVGKHYPSSQPRPRRLGSITKQRMVQT